MGIEKIGWGPAPGGEVELFTLTNGPMQLSVATHGAVVTSLRVPGRSGSGEVALGYGDITGYVADTCYFGCVVGRVANRIGQARFELDNRVHELDANHGAHHLHGGSRGFSTRLWRAEATTESGDPSLRLCLASPDGDQGYPGQLDASVTYTLTDDTLRIATGAECDAPTPVNLVSHIYFNLDGPGAGTCLDHRLLLHASRFQEADDEMIPTGALREVAGTVLDFTEFRPLGRGLDRGHPLLAASGGYDHCFVLEETNGPQAVLESSASGRRMELHTNYPCVQVYSGNYISSGLAGRPGEVYGPASGLCLEAQEYVDAVNHVHFPSVILRPGQRRERVASYRFSLI